MITKELIKWDSKLSVEIKELDNQHKKLIDMINLLFDSMQKGESSKILNQLFCNLLDYTKYHFETEEKYFEKFNYQDTVKHVQEHDKLRQTVKDLYGQCNQKRLFLYKDLLNFLSDWINNHIQGTDKKYVNHFKENGLI